MSVGRRFPPSLPSMKALSEDPGKHLYELWKYIRDSVSGLATPHADTHLPDADADPLTVGDPVSIGITNSEGDDDSFSRSDHVHASGLTTKGDLLTVDTALARLPVGTDTHVLTADSAQTKGIKWATTASVPHEVLSATHTDTLTGTVVRGDVIVGNATPKWSRLAIGTTGKFLRTNGTDPSWQALALSDLPSASGFSVLGKATTGAGDRADIVAADETVLGRTAAGNVAFAQVATGQITNAAVTYPKIQDVSAASRLLGRGSAAGAGDVEEISPGNSVAVTATTLDTIQDIRTTATPQFARMGLGGAADGTALLRLLGGSLFQETASNGAMWTIGYNTELVTIAAAASSDSVADLLPANSLILATTCRVTVTVPGLGALNVGTSSSSSRFESNLAKAAGSTTSGMAQWFGTVTTVAAGPSQATADKVRITPTVVPGTADGRVRVTVFYLTITPPTS